MIAATIGGRAGMSKPQNAGNPRFDRRGASAKLFGVLVEFKNVRQEPGSGQRRWFEGDLYELVVWYRPDRTVEGFQILYVGDNDERALTWREGQGFQHSRVDDGTTSPWKNLAPILLPDGSIPWPRVRREFDENSGSLEPELRSLIRQRLEVQA